MNSLFIQCYYRVLVKKHALIAWVIYGTLFLYIGQIITIPQIHFVQVTCKFFRSVISSARGLMNIMSLISALGWYNFIDTYSRQPNNKARLISPSTTKTNSCLHFYYHMYGPDVGTLQVLIYLIVFIYIFNNIHYIVSYISDWFRRVQLYFVYTCMTKLLQSDWLIN